MKRELVIILLVTLLAGHYSADNDISNLVLILTTRLLYNLAHWIKSNNMCTSNRLKSETQ